MSAKSRLIAAYKRYGFTLVRSTANDEALVFTLKTGYFDNAEIIRLHHGANVDGLFKEFSSAGYACTVRDATTPEVAEEELFNGFFSVESTRSRISEEYRRFTSSLVKAYGEKAKYQYINAPYTVNGKEGQKSPPEEVLSGMEENGPVLFLIEAAAGFGKTCTAQEIAILLASRGRKLPLYAELSRNRQARIFRYILLDEIDRTFPLLGSNLVQEEIRNGRITVILDGFDELLRKGEEGEAFDHKEPMLETVSELLTGQSKIIITTRRTVLFDGDDFHRWLERHADDFTIVKIRIQEPRINDWLSHERTESLKNSGLDIESVANPVLLSYLRCIDDESFYKKTADPECIVQSYFEYMLERERERQDLRMTVQMQGDVLYSLAKDMICGGYVAEDRDYIIKTIIETSSREIEIARNQYISSERPTREEIANKLASHALLDRCSTDSTKIGFINEFCLGNYVAENILQDDGWLSDDMRFIEPAVKSYLPRAENSRSALFDALRESLPFLDAFARIEIYSDLVGALPDDLKNDSADGVVLSNLVVGSPNISYFQFSDSTFKYCKLIKSGLNEVTFLNCKFFDCEVIETSSSGGIYVLGSISSPDITSQLGNSNSSAKSEEEEVENIDRKVDIYILKKFWPAGDSVNHKPSRPIYKPMKYLCQCGGGFSSFQLYAAVERLIKAGFLVEMNRENLIALNVTNLPKVYEKYEGFA